MPSSTKATVTVACPHCGHRQPEPRMAYSTICKQCRAHFRMEEAAQPARKTAKAPIEQRHIRCFQCGAELEVARAATSTMCKRCSSYVDLTDYSITNTIAKNFRTHGRLVIEEKGYVLNTDALVGEAVVKGRLIGKLVADGTLELHSTARIKGTFTATRLVLPEGNQFGWSEPLLVGGAEINGELVANICATGTVVLKSTARFFGDVQAASLVVEPGAVFVGHAKVGPAFAGAPMPGLPRNGWVETKPRRKG